jgi:hypothetical protein
MTATERSPIWLNPPKFWAATREMSPTQVEALIQELMLLAEARNMETLRKFDFIVVRDYPRNAA